jgi:hypothetical protein
MGIKDITRDELLAELIAAIEPPEPGAEWFTVNQVFEELRARDPHAKRDRVYERLRRGYADGKLERVEYKRTFYFRVKE